MGHYDNCVVSNPVASDVQDESTDDSMGFKNISYNNVKKHQIFITGGQKDTLGKSRFDLIPPEAMKCLAQVYSLGADKYEDRNWEKGIPFSACLAALKRHLNSFELGDMINTEDGSHEHMAHVMWWSVALITFIKRGRVDLNDLPHYQKDFNNERPE